MRNIVSIIGSAVALAAGFAGAVYVVTDNQRAEIRSLRQHVEHLQSHPLMVEVEKDNEACVKELARVSRERDFYVTALNRAGERIGDLEQIIAALNEQNLKPAEPVRPVVAGPVVIPDDAANWYATLFVQPDGHRNANEEAAIKMFSDRRWAKELTAKMHFKVLTIDKPEAKAYFPFVPQTPCFMVQGPNGEIVYREVNADLAKCPACLRHQLNKTMRRQGHGNQPVCPGPFCPISQPDPAQPPPSNEVVVKPDQIPAEQPSAMPAVLAALTAGGVTYAVKFGAAVYRGS